MAGKNVPFHHPATTPGTLAGSTLWPPQAEILWKKRAAELLEFSLLCLDISSLQRLCVCVCATFECWQEDGVVGSCFSHPVTHLREKLLPPQRLEGERSCEKENSIRLTRKSHLLLRHIILIIAFFFFFLSLAVLHEGERFSQISHYVQVRATSCASYIPILVMDNGHFFALPNLANHC